jgi:hypothetical protein
MMIGTGSGVVQNVEEGGEHRMGECEGDWFGWLNMIDGAGLEERDAGREKGGA